MRRDFSPCLVAFVVLLGLVLGLFASAPSHAKVFASQNQALAEAFPDATRIERSTRVLRAEEVERIETLIRDEVESKIIVLHEAYKNDELLGHAHIDVHNVRTQPEAFMVVLAPSGVVRSVRVLAFHEPLDYLPTDRWYAQFEGKSKQDRLRVGHDVHGVVGATLSARAASDGVRRMLAYWEVLLKTSEDSPPAEDASSAVGSPEAP